MAYAEVKVEREEKPKGAKLHHLEIHPGDGRRGGHIVEHHMHGNGMDYKPPMKHVFGKDEGPEMMAHIARHAKVKMSEGEERREKVDDHEAEESEGGEG